MPNRAAGATPGRSEAPACRDRRSVGSEAGMALTPDQLLVMKASPADPPWCHRAKPRRALQGSPHFLMPPLGTRRSDLGNDRDFVNLRAGDRDAPHR